MLRRDTSRSYQEVMKLKCEMRLDPAGLISSGFLLAIVVTQKVRMNICSHVITADRSSSFQQQPGVERNIIIYIYICLYIFNVTCCIVV